jgi:hypothetical protein
MSSVTCRTRWRRSTHTRAATAAAEATAVRAYLWVLHEYLFEHQQALEEGGEFVRSGEPRRIR